MSEAEQRAESLRRELHRQERKSAALQRVNADLQRRVRTAEKETAGLQKRIRKMERETADLHIRARKAERGGKLLSRALELLLIRVGLAYGEDVMDEKKGRSIGKCLKLPRDNGDELLRLWQAKARNADELDAIVVAVGLRDDPEDYKSDAENSEGSGDACG
ncbi:MAG: hypothetical protein IJV64_01005 [Oscillospiraceae bacterium]|nr:hypothetical protein [Oscillospiraceae bacterium]